MCKMRCFQKNSVSLHSLRDVAQLVAHYVRDVGVASSSPVIPTIAKVNSHASDELAFFLFPHVGLWKLRYLQTFIG